KTRAGVCSHPLAKRSDNPGQVGRRRELADRRRGPRLEGEVPLRIQTSNKQLRQVHVLASDRAPRRKAVGRRVLPSAYYRPKLPLPCIGNVVISPRPCSCLPRQVILCEASPQRAHILESVSPWCNLRTMPPSPRRPT